MNATSIPVNCPRVSDAESPSGFGIKEPAALAQLAFQSLEAHPAFRGWWAKSSTHIEFNGNNLVLNGRVPSWYLKQLLQEILRRVDGIGSVENRVMVVNSCDHRSVDQASDPRG